MQYYSAFQRHISFGVLAFGCAACGGGGTIEEAPAPIPFFFGAVDDTASGNGLPFFGPATSSDDAVDQEFKTLMVVSEGAAEREDARTSTTPTVFVPSREFINGTGREVTLVIDGVTETLDASGLLADGREVLFDTLLTGTTTTLIGGVIVQPDGFQDTFVFPFGIESAPEILAARPDLAIGAATYEGDILYIGTGFDGAGAAIGDFLLVEGDIVLRADFQSLTIAGDVEAQLAAVDPSARLFGDITPVAITGNGFEGDISWSCESGASCSGSSPFGATFYGESGTEVLGISTIDLDINLSATDETVSLVGAGGFTAIELP